jgi:hypothetical protein
MVRNSLWQSSRSDDTEAESCLWVFTPFPSLRLPLPPLFCLKDLAGAFAISKETVEVELLPVEMPFPPRRITDVFSQLAEFGEVELKGWGVIHFYPNSSKGYS